MRTMISAAALSLLATTVAFAQSKPMTAPAPTHETTAMAPSASATMMTAMPAGGVTVTDYYKQDVYDPSSNKIGEVADVLVDKDGHITAFVVSVGGFLGMGEKDVATPFQSVQMTMKDNKSRLVMDTTKDALKNAPGYKYDKNTTTWVPAKS